METESVQTVVKELARKLDEDPRSVRLTEFLAPAVSAVLGFRMELLEDGPVPQIGCAPSPQTGISVINGCQLLLSVLASARGLAEQLEQQLESESEREPEAA